MSKEKKLVPELRFPEFENAENWTEGTFNDVAVVDTGFAFRSGDLGNSGSGIPVIRMSNLRNGKLDISEALRLPDAIAQERATELEQFELRPGDFLFGMSGSLSNYAWVSIKDVPCYLNQRVGRLISKFGSNPLFIAYLYSSDIVQKSISKNAAGAAIMNISVSDLRSTEIYYPLVAEQQKIASCLSSLDELIQAETDKLDALIAHKKGLMQQLFPAKGKTVPELRFKEFEGDGEWVEKPLGDVATFTKGKGISKADTTPDGQLPCIRYAELYTQYGEVISSVVSKTNVPATDLVLSEANDVIIPSSGETREDIATAACVLDAGIALGGDLNIIRSEINGTYLAYYLTHGRREAISRIAQGDAVVHLYSSQLQKLIIQYPKDELEQQKIADCFTSVDNRIALQTERIATLQAHKKGLMQGLFPTIDN
jgi:type I restriction enzyme S subunit